MRMMFMNKMTDFGVIRIRKIIIIEISQFVTRAEEYNDQIIIFTMVAPMGKIGYCVKVESGLEQ